MTDRKFALEASSSRRRPHPAPPFVAAVNLGVLGLLGAGVLISRWLPPGPFAHGTGVARQLVAYDGGNYRDIALHGYTWNPAIGGSFGHGETMAYFPAWPVIENLLGRLTGALSPWPIIAAGLFFGLWSNLVFSRLAVRLLNAAAAQWATLCFAIWPASCFLVMGYPVGVINLCAASCLWHYVEGRRQRAVLWCGLGTAASPAGVFIAAALCADLGMASLARNEKTFSTWVRLAGLCIVSVWGLIGFMVYQEIKFGDPLAFVTAQGGFSETPPPLAHVLRVFDPLWYLFPLQFTWDTLAGMVHHAGAPAHWGERLCIAWQLDQDLFTVALAIPLLSLAARRSPGLLVPVSGWIVLGGYIWFVATGSFDLLCAMRLLYPALAIFLVLGEGAAKSRFVRYATIAWLAASSVAAVALVAGGYGVI